MGCRINDLKFVKFFAFGRAFRHSGTFFYWQILTGNERIWQRVYFGNNRFLIFQSIQILLNFEEYCSIFFCVCSVLS